MPAARPINHGTHAGYYAHYRKGIAFCEACKHAESEYRKKRSAKPRFLHPDDGRHGTMSGYKYFRCRCFACREANREAKRKVVRQTPRAELANLIASQSAELNVDKYGTSFQGGGNQRIQTKGGITVLSLDAVLGAADSLYSMVAVGTPERYRVEWTDPTAEKAIERINRFDWETEWSCELIGSSEDAVW